MDPQQWLDGFQNRVSELQRKSAELTENLANSGATASSPDGAVTVVIAPNGALQKLELGNRAAEHTPAQLTSLIMKTVGKAQRAAADKVAEAFEPLGGGGEAMRMLASYAPPEVEDDETEERPEPADFTPPDEPQASAPPPAAQPLTPPPAPAFPPPAARPAPAPRPRRSSGAEEEDDDVDLW